MEEREEIEKKVEEGSWSNMSDYIRTKYYAGKSNLTELDPRTGDINDDDAIQLQEQLMQALTDEPQSFGELTDAIIDTCADEIYELLRELADDSQTPVVETRERIDGEMTTVYFHDP